jgi:hypothetical protein
MLKIVFWAVVCTGSVYSFWYAYYLLKDKNKMGAVGMVLIGVLIGGLSFLVELK